jgi:hypothetical protein
MEHRHLVSLRRQQINYPGAYEAGSADYQNAHSNPSQSTAQVSKMVRARQPQGGVTTLGVRLRASGWQLSVGRNEDAAIWYWATEVIISVDTSTNGLSCA